MTKHGSSLTGHADRPLSRRAAALATLTAALWGGTPVAISFAAESLPPVMIAAVRFTMASVFMLFWCRFEKSSIRLGPGQLKLSLVAALLLFLQISSFNIGTVWSNSSHAAMLINTFVFWVVAIEHFVTKTDRLTVRKLSGLMIAMIGTMAVLSVTHPPADSPNVGLDVPTRAGDAVLLASALLLGIRIVYVKHALRRIEPGKLILWHDVFGVVLFTAYSLATEDIAPAQMTMPAVGGLLYQGFLVAGLCFAVQTRLLQKYSALQITMFSFATPLFGVGLAVLFRNDPLSPRLVVSAVCVAIGIFLVNTSPRK